MTTTLSERALVAADRCDRCGAQAHIRVQLPSGSGLLFCAHHGHLYEARLRELEADIHDESKRLESVPAER